MKCLYQGSCKFGKGNKGGKCLVRLKFPSYCRFRVPENRKQIKL